MDRIQSCVADLVPSLAIQGSLKYDTSVDVKDIERK